MTLTDEFLAAARAAAPQTRIYDVDRPLNTAAKDVPARYAVISADPGSLAAMALCGRWDTATIELDVLSVGPDRSSTEALAAAIRDDYLVRQFAAPGWVAEVIEHHAQRPKRDPDIPGRVVIYATDQYRVQATKV